MGGEINFGSRTDFLPGERLEESDIKYERYGGCFVSYKKGVFVGALTLLLAVALAIIVYHYAPCKKQNENGYDVVDAFISELRNSAENSNNEKDASLLTEDITPSSYRIKIQPYLNENATNRFTFDGQISIVFQINGPSTSTIILNAKNLTILDTDISVTYPAVSSIVPLKSESQTKENQTEYTTPQSETTPNITISSTTVILSSILNTTNSTTEIDFNTTKSTTEPTTESSFNSTVSMTESLNTTQFETTIATIVNVTKVFEVLTTPLQKNIYLSPDSAPAIEYIPVIRIKYNENDETYKIRLKFALSKGTNYTLNIKYSGKMTNGPGGILRSNYKQGNETKWLASTLFKPSYARLAFPCFDNPKYKTSVQISIARQTNMRAISNMRLNNTVPMPGSPGWVWDHFEVSPPMPTYLIAFAVFEFTERRTTATVPLPLMKIWTRPDTRNHTTYALNVLPKVLSTFNTFFGYNYSLSKIDLVLIPNYPVTAMGNWGLVFFREDLILSDDNPSQRQKETVTEFMSTELARQWFGNLIGINSWNNLWFMEAMCTYARYIGINNAEPTWEILETLPVTDRQEVLDFDSTNILQKLTDIYGCHSSFNNILNKKGSSILRMLNDSLTEPIFLKGVQNFVEKWKYKTIEPNNMWSELTVLSNKTTPKTYTVEDIVNSWVNEKGYPLISVTTENKTLSIKQSRYSETPSLSSNVWILLVYYYSNLKNTTTKVWLDDGTPRVIGNVSKTENDTWIIANTQQTSLCRMNYDLNNWKSVEMLLRSKPDTVSPSTRAQLLDDAFHLARTGQLNNYVPLNLIRYLKDNENHLIPWTTVLKYFESLTEVFAKHSIYGDFQDYVVKVIEPIYNKLGTVDQTSDSISTIKLRTEIVYWACTFNYKPCIDWAYPHFEELLNKQNDTNVSANMRPIIYCTGVQMIGRTAWEFLWNKYSISKDTNDEMKAFIIGLGCTKEAWLITKYLNLALKEESTQNSVLMWEHLSSNIAIDTAFKFLQENWGAIYEKYSHSEFITILKHVLSRLATKTDLDQVIELFTVRKIEVICFAPDIISIVEQIKRKLAWKEKFLTDFPKWVAMNNI